MSEFDPEKPIKRIKPKKASDETVIEVGKPEPETMQPVAVKSVAQSGIHNQVDTVWVKTQIEGLQGRDLTAFKRYAATFRADVLPKQAEGAYLSWDAESRLCWLWLRWKALGDLMTLGTYLPVRELTPEELNQCVEAVILDETILDLHQIMVLGFAMNDRMVAQVRHAILNAPTVIEYFPEIRARFVTETL